MLVTKSFIFLGEGTNTGVAGQPHPWGGIGGKMFRAYDKQTGEVVREIELPGGTTGAPMTYMVDGTQYVAEPFLMEGGVRGFWAEDRRQGQALLVIGPDGRAEMTDAAFAAPLQGRCEDVE